jgi:MoaA/NifB/PqqE/SkfB family radical SAM enzyme
MSAVPLPRSVNWHLTYACQLRCTHCYTESGRRPSRKLPREQILRVADVLCSMQPRFVLLGGGEPLLVPELYEIGERLARAKIKTRLFTNGIDVADDAAAELGRRFTYVHVSLDGVTAAVHDAIRGRAGAFEEAMRTLGALDRAASAQRDRGQEEVRFGIDVTLVRSNFDQLEEFCSVIPASFPALRFVQLGAAAPSGLASRESYVEQELLTEEQLTRLRDPRLKERLRALSPASVKGVSVTDGFTLVMGPEQIGAGIAQTDVMEIEADGSVRGLLVYEGTVGNLLEEPPEVLWQRVQEREQHPFVVRELSGVRTMSAWAAAVRRIDRHFASGEDLIRLARRQAPPASPREP